MFTFRVSRIAVLCSQEENLPKIPKTSGLSSVTAVVRSTRSCEVGFSPFSVLGRACVLMHDRSPVPLWLTSNNLGAGLTLALGWPGHLAVVAAARSTLDCSWL